MSEFGERLKELMEENNIKAEALSKNLNGQISANTIRAYAKGIHKPNSIENIKILANFFNVSTDYIQGFTNEKTTNVKVKNISNIYGLSEKALKNLKEFNYLAERNESFTHIKTINFILSQDTKKIWTLIDRYLNMKINPYDVLIVGEKGNLEVGQEIKSKATNLSAVDACEGGILQQLSVELNKLKKKVNEDECKRTRKK